MKGDIGVIGLAVMGQNLALNISRNGYVVTVFNRTAKRTEDFMKRVKDEKIIPTFNIEDFAKSLERPRKIILMVKAGEAVDKVIDALLPHLEKGDLIIDGGNSNYKDTERRFERLSKEGILLLGMGVSGGEYGALHGPSMMPGGSIEGYRLVEDILKKIAAKSDEGPCCEYMGDRSAGHFVKMTHNGIEYVIMQSIVEIYDIMRKALNMKAQEIGKIFKRWNEGELSSFLIEITYKIMEKIDEETKKPMVDVILDKAGHKGTGKWATQSALDLGVPTFSMASAIFSRIISYYKEDRIEISKLFETKVDHEKPDGIIDDMEKALLFSMFLAFSQGLWLINAASKEYNYGTDLLKVLKVWKNGCIIRAKMIDFIKDVLKDDISNVHLLKSKKALEFVKDKLNSTLKVVEFARNHLIPTPALNSSLDYFLSMVHEKLPANLIQAQRDYFGAHTFERVDKEGVFHVEWYKLD